MSLITDSCKHQWRMFDSETVRCTACHTHPTLWVPKPKSEFDVIYTAQDHQKPYHESDIPNLIMVGPRGTGKSLTERMDAHMRALVIPGYRYLIIRRQLRELKTSHLQFMNNEMDRLGGDFHNGDYIAKYPNGSLGYFGYADSPADMMRYLSAEYDLVIVDEVTTFIKEIILKMLSCVRVPEGIGRIGLFRGGTNKLGPGAEFVREYFYEKSVDPVENPDYNPVEWGVIQHKWGDNKKIDLAQYRQRLAVLPEHVRKAWLDDEWVIEGAYFSDFRPYKNGEPWHVIPEMPTFQFRGMDYELMNKEFVRIYRAIDWGYDPDPAVCLWIAVLPNKRTIVFKERTWRRTTAQDVAKQIKEESKGMRVVETFCLPLDAPVWMGDFSFKPLSEVKVGDEVISGPIKHQKYGRKVGVRVERGYTSTWKAAHRGKLQRCLQRAKVTAIHRTRQEVLRLTFSSGRTAFCTPDHRWLSGKSFHEQFVKPEIGRKLVYVVDDPGPPADAGVAAWMGGIYDGEGCRETICQSPSHNPVVYQAIYDRLLQLGFSASKVSKGISWHGGLQGAVKFVNQVPSLRYRSNWADYFILRSHYRTPDEIVGIELCGVQDVGCITTTTGNFVAYGYISSNCDPTMSIDDGRGQYSLGELFEINGVPLTPSMNKRDMYGIAIHHQLNTFIDGKPQLQILAPDGYNGCKELIKTFPLMTVDPKDPNKMGDGNDHWVVALAYYCMGSATPINTAASEEKPRWMRPKPDSRPRMMY